MTTSLSSNRCIALLDSLLELRGPQGFGRVMEKFVAHCFRREGYWVISNAIGVPDFVAVRPTKPRGFAVEVKTATGRKLQLMDRELKAVAMSEHEPVLAVLIFPDLNPRWLCVDANSLRSGAIDIIALHRKPQVLLDFDLNTEFRAVVAEFHEAAMTSTYSLDHALQRSTINAGATDSDKT